MVIATFRRDAPARCGTFVDEPAVVLGDGSACGVYIHSFALARFCVRMLHEMPRRNAGSRFLGFDALASAVNLSELASFKGLTGLLGWGSKLMNCSCPPCSPAGPPSANTRELTASSHSFRNARIGSTQAARRAGR
jgi:hypothetical protein